QEHPAGGKAEPVIKIAIGVLVSAAGDRHASSELSAAECGAGCDQRRQRNGQQNGRTGHARGNADAGEDPGADHCAEAHHGGAKDAKLAAEAALHFRHAARSYCFLRKPLPARAVAGTGLIDALTCWPRLNRFGSWVQISSWEIAPRPQPSRWRA